MLRLSPFILIICCTFLVAACGPKGTSPQGLPGSVPGDAAPVVIGPLETSGRVLNEASFERLPAQLPQTRVFSLNPSFVGQLVLGELQDDFGSCERGDLTIQFQLAEFDERGAVAALHDLQPMRPVLLQAKPVELRVIAMSAKECAGYQRNFGVHAYAQKKTDDDPASSGRRPITGDDDDDDENPPPTPSPTPTPRPTPDPVPVDPRPCPWPPEPDSLSPLHQAGIQIVGKLSNRDGCAMQYRWRVLDHLSRPQRPRCQLDEASVEYNAGRAPHIKISQAIAGRDLATNLAWLNTARDNRGQEASRTIATALEAGEDVVIALDPDCGLGSAGISGNPSTWASLDSALDLLFFRGDPRHNGQVLEVKELNLDITDPEQFEVRYDYRSRDEFAWAWTFKVADADRPQLATDEQLEIRLYNRQAKAFATTWLPLEELPTSQWRVAVTDPASLFRVLPQQQHLELILRAKSCGDECDRLWAIPLGVYVFEQSLSGRFFDEANPGRHHYQVVEADLPEIE